MCIRDKLDTPCQSASDLGQVLRAHHQKGHQQDDHQFGKTYVEHPLRSYFDVDDIIAQQPPLVKGKTGFGSNLPCRIFPVGRGRRPGEWHKGTAQNGSFRARRMPSAHGAGPVLAGPVLRLKLAHQIPYPGPGVHGAPEGLVLIPRPVPHQADELAYLQPQSLLHGLVRAPGGNQVVAQ